MSEENQAHFARIAQQSVTGGISPPTRLLRPGGGRAAPEQLPAAAAAEPVAAAPAAAPAGDDEDMVRLNWYLTPAARAGLTRMRDEVFHSANIAVPGSAPTKYHAASALVEVVEADFERLKHLALAKLTGRGQEG